MNSTKELLTPYSISQIKEANNFDFIRFFLAYSVMFNHFSTLTDTDPFWFVSGGFRVKGFFIISGFLVMFSYLRKPDIKIYFRKRIQRIMPAYSLAILICVLIGACITTLSFQEFFSSPELYSYLISNLFTLNFISPSLPGVFENNPIHVMNGSLWTIKVELMLYVTIPFLYWILKKYNKTVCLVSIYVLSYIYTSTFDYLDNTSHSAIYGFLKRQFPGQMMYFCSGIIILLYFDLFRKYMKYIFVTSILLFICRDITLFKIFEPIALASMIVSVAYGFRWLHFINKMGNFSYGIFLIHFPVIQVLIYWGLDKYSFLLTLAITTLFSTCIGMLSWKYVEKPSMYKR